MIINVFSRMNLKMNLKKKNNTTESHVETD